MPGWAVSIERLGSVQYVTSILLGLLSSVLEAFPNKAIDHGGDTAVVESR